MAAMVRLVFQALEHPNVLKLLDFFEDERFYYLAAWPLGFEVAGFLVCFFFKCDVLDTRPAKIACNFPEDLEVAGESLKKC